MHRGKGEKKGKFLSMLRGEKKRQNPLFIGGRDEFV